MPWSCSTISLLLCCIFISFLFYFLAFTFPLACSLLFLYLFQRMPQTKQLQDHTKRRQSVEDQAPYGEHINSKACGTHSHPSHLHMPLICIFTKRPLWLSLISKPLPTASSAHASLTKENQAGWQRVPAGTTHAYIQLIHTNAQNQFLHTRYTNVQWQSKQKNQKES